MEEPTLRMRKLKVIFPSGRGIIRAVEGVDIDIEKGECVALVGESGCGKSVTSRSIMKLIDSPPALTRVDELYFGGKDIKDFSESEMRKVRGKEMAMIFQDAMEALNPVITCGKQIAEIFLRHHDMDKKEARRETVKALELVGVPEPASRAKNYPHELSGGMRQRVLLAMAFACMPKLILADEPTTSLDVTIQAQVLNELRNLQKSHDVSLLLVTHDLSVVSNLADKVYVMYSGKIVEKASLRQLFEKPHHPYSIGLLNSVPKLSDEESGFEQIPGTVPHPMRKPEGCYFHPRCNHATEKCKKEMPPLSAINDESEVRCWHPRNMEREEAMT